MAKEISKLKEHYIICGYGRLGRHEAVEMGHFGAQYVVIERQPETVAKAKGDGHLTLVGDATDGQTLRAAGIDRAKGLVAATVGDAENTFITLTARKMNPDVYIVACASNDDAEDKMKTAGADEVVSAYLMGGKMLSSALLNPGIDCLINAILTGAAWQPVKILEVEPDSDAAHEGMTVGEARARTQALILAVGHSADEFGVNPSDDAVLSGGNSVAALGTVEQLSLLRNLLEAA